MKTIGQFLEQDNRAIHAVRPDATLREGLEFMVQHNIGVLMVLND